MDEFKNRYVHRVRSRKGVFIFYYRRGDGFRMLLGTSSQPLFELKKAYENAADTYAQFHCKIQLPAKKDVVARLIRGATERAAKYGREITITPEFVRALLVEQKFRCALTGLQFSMQNKHLSHIRPYGPSIDRIDNAGGYVPGNVRIVCNIANIARNAFSDEDFYAMCFAAANMTVKRTVNANGRQVVSEMETELPNSLSLNG